MASLACECCCHCFLMLCCALPWGHFPRSLQWPVCCWPWGSRKGKSLKSVDASPGGRANAGEEEGVGFGVVPRPLLRSLGWRVLSPPAAQWCCLCPGMAGGPFFPALLETRLNRERLVSLDPDKFRPSLAAFPRLYDALRKIVFRNTFAVG